MSYSDFCWVCERRIRIKKKRWNFFESLVACTVSREWLKGISLNLDCGFPWVEGISTINFMLFILDITELQVWKSWLCSSFQHTHSVACAPFSWTASCILIAYCVLWTYQQLKYKAVTMLCFWASYTVMHDEYYHPDHLADSCKRSSINRMAAGSRLSWCIMDFSPVCNFSNILSKVQHL